MSPTQQLENAYAVDGKKALRERINALEKLVNDLGELLTQERLKREAAEAELEDFRINGPRVSIKADNGEVSIVAVVAGQRWGAEQKWTVQEFKEKLGI